VLEAALAAGGARSELVPEIRKIATRHGIVTKFTAGLVLEPGDRPDAIETEEVEDSDMHDAPFTGASTNAAIGLGGGAGGGSRRRNLRAGTAKLMSSAEDALKWLATQQQKDGRVGSLRDTADVVLAYLAAGYTDRGSTRDNPYSGTVRRALRALMNNQDADGRFGKDLRTHIRATTAMCEAYWMTRNPRYKKPAQKGLDYLALVRTKYSAWPKEKPDTVTTAEAVLALRSGKFAGLDVDPDAFEGARQWFNTKGAVKTATEREAVLFARVLLGERIAAHPDNAAALKTIAGREWAALAEFQITGRVNEIKTLVAAGKSDGSWGSVRDTAAAVRILTTRYRYDRVFKR